MHEEAKKFFVNYFKQIALVFGGAWNGRKYSIRSASALRAFIRVAPDVVRRLDQEHADRARLPRHRPASSRRGAAASATCGSKPKARGSAAARRSIRWPKELRLALQYPEGAAV